MFRSEPRRILASTTSASDGGDVRDVGYVTAETAMVLPVFVLLLAVAMWAIAVGRAQLSAVDAARDGARAAARGESSQVVAQVIREAAPDGADFAVTTEGGEVTVVVRDRVGPAAGPLARLPAPIAAATAVAQSESESESLSPSVSPLSPLSPP
jgi:hypothetical protein